MKRITSRKIQMIENEEGDLLAEMAGKRENRSEEDYTNECDYATRWRWFAIQETFPRYDTPVPVSGIRETGKLRALVRVRKRRS